MRKGFDSHTRRVSAVCCGWEGAGDEGASGLGQGVEGLATLWCRVSLLVTLVPSYALVPSLSTAQCRHSLIRGSGAHPGPRGCVSLCLLLQSGVFT